MMMITFQCVPNVHNLNINRVCTVGCNDENFWNSVVVSMSDTGKTAIAFDAEKKADAQADVESILGAFVSGTKGGGGGGGGGLADAEAGDGAGATEEGCAEMVGSAGVEEEKCGDTESEPEEETPGIVEEPIFSQSVIDMAFDAQLTINLMVEFEEVFASRAVALNINWKEFPEVKSTSSPATHILTWREKLVVDMGPVLKTYFIEKDPDCALFGYMENHSYNLQGVYWGVIFSELLRAH